MGYRIRHYEIPDHMMHGLEAYASHGYLPGQFLQSVITNDLAHACAGGDDENLANLPAFVAWLYNEAPPQCWGSPEKMKAWVAHMAEQRELARIKR